MTSSNSSQSNSAPMHHNVVPSEVGWQFVPQYYTFVNKQPDRLHCFYTKTSTFIHGTEGEEGKPCYGQLEIHNKITSIGFQDCKVFIHSVDAQSSANGGIIIQVIGEMSNAGSTWRKFVQTFFLAEQPNGYFVLNDIFRFLKEESVEGESEDGDGEREAFGHASNEPEQPAPVEAEQVQEQATVDEPTAPTTDTYERSAAPSPSPEPTPAPEPAPVPEPRVETPAPVVEAAPSPTPAPASAPNPPQVNGVHAVPEPEVIEPPKPSTPAPVVSAPTPPPAASPAPAPPIVPPTAAPRPVAQPAPPKTWANLAAANSKKWGSAVAQESRGTTEVPVAAHPQTHPHSAPAPRGGPAPGSGSASASAGPPRGQGTATPPRGGAQGRQGGQGGEHPALVAAQTVTTAACFVKGVTEPITSPVLTSTLTQRFGAIKDLEIVRNKACAFMEFTTVESARKAIIASLPVNMGGEGGVRIDVGEAEGPIRIVVETRRERGDRPPSRPRGGAPVNGEARGGFGGAGRGRGAGRGARGGAAAK